MMKDGLLERIRQIGHWRVLMRPLVPLHQPLTFQQCSANVENARVSIRGWDYPHISRRQDDQGGEERSADYLENWCDWHTQIEFWHMYRSGQFLSYNALDDDLMEPNAGGRRLNVIGAIYTLTEFVEFSHRLAAAGLYRDGLHLTISLINTRDRYLEAGRGRMPFFDFQRTQADTITMERQIDREGLDFGATSTSNSMLVELFDRFGWNPDPNQIRADQEAFYRRDFR